MLNLPTTFSALADETRFAIVERLLREGAQTAGDIAGIAPISAPAISRHLKVLREAGVIAQRIEGARRIYSVRPEAIVAISDWTMTHRDFWVCSLDRLERALTKLEDT